MSPRPAFPTAIAGVVAAVRQSKRYGRIDESVVRRCASQAMAVAGHRPHDAIKRTKRYLHQVYGAYVGAAPRYDRLLSRLRQARAGDPASLAVELRRVMRLHASTRERVEHLEEFYEALFSHVGPVRSILDVGCGLNPLAVPSMRLLPDGVYTAVDIEPALVAFVGSCLDMLSVRAHARVSDAVSNPPDEDADLALLLKMLPCLEQQQRGAGADLIRGLRVKRVAVSFPIRSLGGRAKGMHASYARMMEEMVQRERWTAREIPVRGELLYLLTKSTPGAGPKAPQHEASPVRCAAT